MTQRNWAEVTHDDVIHAIATFLSCNPKYPEPRSTYLVFEGQKLPAKHIRGMAYREHYGVEISKEEFSGGKETVRFFERLGFAVDYGGTTVRKHQKGESPAPETAEKTEEPKDKTLPAANVDASAATVSPAKKHDKITIPSKQVIEQKNALQLILNKMFDGDIVCEKTYPWLKTPTELTGPYAALHKALSAYRGDTAFAKRNVALRCDFVCESKKLIIEYDERQHFSEARRISLEAYADVPLSFDRKKWIKACRDIGAKDNAPANRDEVRAYYDSTRDIACWENGYRLVRIMHGQLDFEKEGAYKELEKMLEPVLTPKEEVIKVGMYLQTEELKNRSSFDAVLPILKTADADIIVFPEHCYVPFDEQIKQKDISSAAVEQEVMGLCLQFSKELGKAVIVSTSSQPEDGRKMIYSIYANAFATGEDTQTALYVKHTMCGKSALEQEDYPKRAGRYFAPIRHKGFNIGMTICYDCNHALFSRIYGLSGIDLIINSTGGNVVYNKWFKYNKVRAIENDCATLVTMGGDGTVKNGHNYVFGFNRNGGQLTPKNLCGSSEKHNEPGGLYVYTIGKEPGEAEPDDSNPFETVNKKRQLFWPVAGSKSVLAEAEKVTDSIYRKQVGRYNVFLLLVDGLDILKPEVVQPLLYAKEIHKYPDRKYMIVNHHEHVDEQFFTEKLSVVLKVRAMENYCAVILESDNINKCYQCGKSRTVQVVRAEDGAFGIDLERTTGPDAIWKDKEGMRASWRKNYEWLVENVCSLYE